MPPSSKIEKTPTSTLKTTKESSEIVTTKKAEQSGYKRVCYFTNWSIYRSGIGKYTVDDIDTSLCTHIVYAFAILNSVTFKLQMSEPDIDRNGYRSVTATKSKEVKVLLAVGGWNDATNKYSVMVSSKENRSSFIKSAVNFLKQYDFDGLDLDWEYPKCWQMRCNQGPPSDKENFARLVQELREAFNNESIPLMLTCTLTANSNVAKEAYDIPSLSRNVDFFNVMTYDYSGLWTLKTRHPVPLYAEPGDNYPHLNINYTINYYLNAGVPASKLVVGIVSNGKSFTLTDPERNGLDEPLNSDGRQGEFTKMPDVLAFYEICRYVKEESWNKVDGNSITGPYAYKGNQWVGYLDVDAAATVANYVKDNKLGGAMLWTMDFDDFTGSCCSTKSPLHTTVKTVLSGTGPSVNQIKLGCPA
ncbi:Cht3 (predicted) [Pycnogonum litorale]